MFYIDKPIELDNYEDEDYRIEWDNRQEILFVFLVAFDDCEPALSINCKVFTIIEAVNMLRAIGIEVDIWGSKRWEESEGRQ